MFIGLLVGLFVPEPAWVVLMLGGLLIGAVSGAVFGFFAHWSTRGQRDFASVSGLVTGSYDVLVANEIAEPRRSLLAA